MKNKKGNSMATVLFTVVGVVMALMFIGIYLGLGTTVLSKFASATAVTNKAELAINKTIDEGTYALANDWLGLWVTIIGIVVILLLIGMVAYFRNR